jgi:hypothetical protein
MVVVDELDHGTRKAGGSEHSALLAPMNHMREIAGIRILLGTYPCIAAIALRDSEESLGEAVYAGQIFRAETERFMSLPLNIPRTTHLHNRYSTLRHSRANHVNMMPTIE